MLGDQLGLDPSPALQRLEHQILNQDPELAAPDTFDLRGAPRPRPGRLASSPSWRPRTRARALDRVRTVIGQHGGFELGADGDPCSSPLPAPRRRCGRGRYRADDKKRRRSPDRHQLGRGDRDGRRVHRAGRPRCGEHLGRRAPWTDPSLADDADLLRETTLDRTEVLDLGGTG